MNETIKGEFFHDYSMYIGELETETAEIMKEGEIEAVTTYNNIFLTIYCCSN